MLLEDVCLVRHADDDEVEPVPGVSEVGKLVGNQSPCKHLHQTLGRVQQREDNSTINALKSCTDAAANSNTGVN